MLKKHNLSIALIEITSESQLKLIKNILASHEMVINEEIRKSTKTYGDYETHKTLINEQTILKSIMNQLEN